MYICVKLSHFAVQQKLTQHHKSTTLQFKKKKKQLRGLGTLAWARGRAESPLGRAGLWKPSGKEQIIREHPEFPNPEFLPTGLARDRGSLRRGSVGELRNQSLCGPDAAPGRSVSLLLTPLFTVSLAQHA